MKVLWICHFSNSQVREKLNLSKNIFEVLIRKLLKKTPKQWSDFGAWITNGIAEFEKNKNIELHIISPHYGMSYNTEEFEMNGIYYHFFKPDDNSFVKRALKSLRKIILMNYDIDLNIIMLHL